MEQKSLSKALKTWFGVGDFMYNLCISFKTYYWMYFLTTVVALPLVVTSATNTIINIFDTVLAFFWGAIIDSMRPGKWGRYRTILIIAAPLIVVSHAAQWFAPTIYTFGASTSVTAILTVVTFCIYIVFFNLAWTANVALINVCASTEADRAVLSGTRNAWTMAASIFIGYIATFLLKMFDNPVIGYAMAATLLGILTIPGYYVHFRLTKGYELERADYEKLSKKESLKNTDRISFKQILTIIQSNIQLLWVLLINTGTTLAMFVFAYMAVYLFEMTLKAPEMYAFYLTIINFGGVLGSILSNILSKKMPIKKMVQFGLVAGIVSLFVVWQAALKANAILFTIAMILVQFFLSFIAPGILTFYSNCAVYSEWKTNINSTGTIMGLCGVPIKLALVAIGIIVPAVLGAAGYVAGEEVTVAVSNGLANAFALIPIALYVMALILLTFFYKLTREKVDQYSQEIIKRKNNI